MLTQEERNVAVERFETNKSKSSQFNYFGEDNHKKLDAVIDTIKNDRSEDWIYQNYPSEKPGGGEDTEGHGLWEAAMTARRFLNGEVNIEDMLYPET